MDAQPYRMSRGLTLIELMIVVVIISILAAIAVPSYTAYVRRSHRVEAKTALLDLAGREERYFSTSQTGANYSQTAADLGYPAGASRSPSAAATTLRCAPRPWDVRRRCDTLRRLRPVYEIAATAVAGSTQVNDTQCWNFAVDNTGKQWAHQADVDNTPYCWNN